MEDFDFKAPKTKEYLTLLDNLKLKDTKSIVILNEPVKNVYLASRNIQESKVVTISELSTYDIMNASKVVFIESSINNLQKED